MRIICNDHLNIGFIWKQGGRSFVYKNTISLYLIGICECIFLFITHVNAVVGVEEGYVSSNRAIICINYISNGQILFCWKSISKSFTRNRYPSNEAGYPSICSCTTCVGAGIDHHLPAIMELIRSQFRKANSIHVEYLTGGLR